MPINIPYHPPSMLSGAAAGIGGIALAMSIQSPTSPATLAAVAVFFGVIALVTWPADDRLEVSYGK